MKPRLPCQTNDPDLWFPVGYTGPAVEQAERAKALCDLCPLKEACLEWAFAIGAEFGVWGGATEHERRMMRRNGTAPTPKRMETGDHRDRTALVSALAS